MKFGEPVRIMILIWLALAASVNVWLFDLLIFPTGIFLAQAYVRRAGAGCLPGEAVDV